MSNIEELIEQLCAVGVEFKELGDIVRKVKGVNKNLPKSKISIVGKIPVYTQSANQKPDGYTDELNLSIEEVPVILYGDHTNVLKWITHEFIIGADGVKIIKVKDDSILLDKFLFYCLKEGIINIPNGYARHFAELRKMQIPIPSLHIQQEIVTILDKFTQLNDELEEELQARRTQYEYYRNNLLNFEGKEVEWKTLGEIGEFTRGKRFVKNDIVTEGVPCIHYGEMYTHYNIWAKESKSFLVPALAAKLRVAHTGDVIIVAAGETVEDIGKGVAWLGESDVVIHDACFAFTHKLDPKYVSHYLQTELFHTQIKKSIKTGKISSINGSGLSKALIPIPSIEVQQKIVSLLDKFKTLVTDKSVGLPAEIEARRKQYEYYRGKLLDFKPKTQTTMTAVVVSTE